MTRFLITGGAGFIGSHLVDRLIKEDPEWIVVVDDFSLGKKSNLAAALKAFKRITIVRGDVADKEFMQRTMSRHSIDVVYHLAAVPLPRSLVEPGYVVEKQVMMTTVLCELLRQKYYTTLIQFSSSEVYGTAESEFMSEDHPLHPITPYAASKAAADLIALSYYKTFGCEVLIFRPFNQYGPRQNKGEHAAVVPVIIERVRNKETVFVTGNGEQTRDFTYVLDTVDAAILLYKKKNVFVGKPVNIGSTSVSIKNLAKTILRLMGSSSKIKHTEKRVGDVQNHSSTSHYAKDLLGWKSTTKLNAGLSKTIAWYKDSQEMKK